MKKQYVLIFHVYLLLNVMVSSIASVMIIFKESKLPLMQVLLPGLLIHYYSMEYPEHVLLETLTSKARLLDTIKNTIIGRHILHPSNSTHHRYK